ncbi:MAG: RNB domain-containing ribonuclease, partial [Alphaproteobacteria bacterium]
MVRASHTGPPVAALRGVLLQVAPRPLLLREIASRLGLERFDLRSLEAALATLVAERMVRRVGKTRWQWVGERLERPGRPERPWRPERPGRPGEERDRHGRFDARPATPGGRRPAVPGARAWSPGGPRERDRRDSGRESDRREAPRREMRAPALTVVGRYSRTRGGFGFVAPEASSRERLGADVFVPEGQEADALHGDRVRVEVLRHDPVSRRAAGRVVEVVESGVDRIVGVLETARRPSAAAGGARATRRPRPGTEASRRWWLVPQSDLLPLVEIAGGMEPSAFDAGKLALVRLLRRPGPGRGAAGDLERVLGDAEDPDVQFLTIALERGLRTEFPPAVVAECAGLPTDPGPSDLAEREDLRHLPFVTIDGESARDFDDAVCHEPSPGGGHRLRVAIADVSHYVRPGTALDAEALARGTSVYFPDRAIPML